MTFREASHPACRTFLDRLCPQPIAGRCFQQKAHLIRIIYVVCSVEGLTYVEDVHASRSSVQVTGVAFDPGFPHGLPGDFFIFGNPACQGPFGLVSSVFGVTRPSRFALRQACLRKGLGVRRLRLDPGVGLYHLRQLALLVASPDLAPLLLLILFLLFLGPLCFPLTRPKKKERNYICLLVPGRCCWPGCWSQ